MCARGHAIACPRPRVRQWEYGGKVKCHRNPEPRTLVAQAGDVLGAWGMSLETSRELVAVRQRGHRIAVANDNQMNAWRGAAVRITMLEAA